VKLLRDTIGLRLALLSAAAAILATLSAVGLETYWRATYRDEGAARIAALQIVSFRDAVSRVGGAAVISSVAEGNPLGFSASPPEGRTSSWPGPWMLRNLRAELGEPDADLQALHVPGSSRPLWIGFEAQGARWWLQLAIRPQGRPWPVVLLVLVAAGLAAAGVAGGWLLIVRPLRQLRDDVVAADVDAVSLAGSAPRNQPGEIAEVSAAFSRLLRQLADQRRERDLALAAISHDLRSPLARLRMRLEGEVPDSLRQPAIEDVMRVDRVLGQFLAFVRGAEAPAGPLVDAAALMDRLAQRNAGRTVCMTGVPAGVPALPAELFDRVADNLIDNALRYGRPPVEVRLWADGPGVVLEVADHGPGIAPADQAAALSPFVRLDASRSGDGQSGLGLATVVRLLRGHGGGISFARRDGLFVVAATFGTGRQLS